METQDQIDALEIALGTIREAVAEMKNVARSMPNGSWLERGVISHIEMALDSDHNWLGKNMTTLSDVIDELKNEARATPEAFTKATGLEVGQMVRVRASGETGMIEGFEVDDEAYYDNESWIAVVATESGAVAGYYPEALFAIED